ncbi:MAG: hypothetical protein M3463_01000 [Verrucomicrobiota bacterium]|nr:hypothetical protein [Verrucomicrobiota bacterium]
MTTRRRRFIPIVMAITCPHILTRMNLRCMATGKMRWRPRGMDRWFGQLGFYRTLRPILIGVVHGLAGSAAVALLVLPVIGHPIWAMAYLLIFGVGTIAGMMLITAAIAVPITYSTGRSQLLNRTIGTAAGVLSLAFGVFLFYQIGFVDGLFTR